LIGFNYAGLHPVSEKSCENLLLLKNEFGTCLGGSHQQLKEGTVNHVQHLEVYHVGKGHHITLDDFVDAENLGVSCSPACGSCKCGQCALGSKNCTIKEEKELDLISNNLQHKGDHWETSYPWVKDPRLLHDNRSAAKAILRSTEKRLNNQPQLAETYSQQIVIVPVEEQ